MERSRVWRIVRTRHDDTPAATAAGPDRVRVRGPVATAARRRVAAAVRVATSPTAGTCECEAAPTTTADRWTAAPTAAARRRTGVSTIATCRCAPTQTTVHQLLRRLHRRGHQGQRVRSPARLSLLLARHAVLGLHTTVVPVRRGGVAGRRGARVGSRGVPHDRGGRVAAQRQHRAPARRVRRVPGRRTRRDAPALPRSEPRTREKRALAAILTLVLKMRNFNMTIYLS